MPRPLPSLEEARLILAAKKTRPPRRPPPVAGRALNGLLKRLDERFGKGADGLQARWREVVGEAIALRTEVVKLGKARAGAGAVLELRVDGPAAALIQHQAPEILARVNLFLGEGAVDKLRIVQGPVRRAAAAEAAAKAALAKRRRSQPLDAAVEAALTESLARHPDSALSAALQRLGREVLRQGR
jgi:hypothetical protein